MRILKGLSAIIQAKNRSEKDGNKTRLAECRNGNRLRSKDSVLNNVRLVYLIPTVRYLSKGQ